MKNNHVIFKNIQKNNANPNAHLKRKIQRINTIKLSTKKLTENNDQNSDNDSKDGNLKIDDYQDLFFYFLLNMEKIEYFEHLIIKKNERKIDNNCFFLNIYESLTTNKIYWHNFYFPKYVFILFYIKSKNLQKEIIKYSISRGKEIMEVINSYNKIYTAKTKIKNWRLKPIEAHLNYEKIRQKKNPDMELTNNNNATAKINNFTDFVIKTNNKGKGKTLIVLGKTINIYIDDLQEDINRNKGLSMATEDSEFNTKVKNEIIYTFDDDTLKLKKGNIPINNTNFINHNIINPNKNNSNFGRNKYTKISRNSKLLNFKKERLKLKCREKYFNKTVIKKNIFNFHTKQSKILPLIDSSRRKKYANNEIPEVKPKNKNYSFIKANKVQKWFPKKLQVNKGISFNSVLNCKNEDKKDNKTIINFFSKKDNDFYY